MPPDEPDPPPRPPRPWDQVVLFHLGDWHPRDGGWPLGFALLLTGLAALALTYVEDWSTVGAYLLDGLTLAGPLAAISLVVLYAARASESAPPVAPVEADPSPAADAVRQRLLTREQREDPACAQPPRPPLLPAPLLRGWGGSRAAALLLAEVACLLPALLPAGPIGARAVGLFGLAGLLVGAAALLRRRRRRVVAWTKVVRGVVLEAKDLDTAKLPGEAQRVRYAYAWDDFVGESSREHRPLPGERAYREGDGIWLLLDPRAPDRHQVWSPLQRALGDARPLREQVLGLLRRPPLLAVVGAAIAFLAGLHTLETHPGLYYGWMTIACLAVVLRVVLPVWPRAVRFYRDLDQALTPPVAPPTPGAQAPRPSPPARTPAVRAAGTIEVVIQPDQRCPLCFEGLGGLAPGALRTCKGCRTTFHRECIAELGTCTTQGCSNRRRVRA